MNIRFATSKDKKQILGLLDEASIFLKAKDVPSVVGGKMFDKVIKRRDIKMFVAEEGNNLVGTMTLYLLPNIRHGYLQGQIEHVFVKEKMRGKGAGSLILEKIKAYCRGKNIKVVKLNSGNELREAHKFYEKNGGKTTERFFRFDVEP
jgi:GNAT superfamily N-acetyltransferase